MSRITRRPLVAGNWKMNLTHLDAIALVQKISFSLTEVQLERVEVVVVPPFISLRSVRTLVDGDKIEIGYGAQDLSPHAGGAYTGDISGHMLSALKCRYVLVGHSERREHHHEDDALVNAKLRAARAVGLLPILCLGEGLQVRQAGDQIAHCVAQLDAALSGLVAGELGEFVVAYEPIWAIGTGEVATPQDAQEVCGALRTRLKQTYGPEVAAATRILYGGSVKADNAAGIFAQPDVDGGLVGGASVQAEDFATICRAAAD
ncbi:MAG: triose-phosphate isomerase [Geodermatophilaceae bacterium]|nr:triose-phosphate isomerase [Geodermatophilaceae bacterium]